MQSNSKMKNTTRSDLPQTGSESFDEARFIRVLYRYGSWLVGLALLFGLGAIAMTNGRPPVSDRAALLFVKIPLLALWLLPVIALLGPGMIMVWRRRTSVSGWLALGMAIVLAGLWSFV
jgi:hypothetical protein